MTVHLLDNTVLQHKLGLLRDKNTHSEEFRRLLGELSVQIFYEALQQEATATIDIETPLATTQAQSIDTNISLVSVMRAGNGMLDPILKFWPTASVGHFGIYRDKQINSTVEYYFKMPAAIAESTVFLLDPVLATGETANACIERMKEIGCSKIRFLSLIASKPGLEMIEASHPDVKLYAINTDDTLAENGFMTPGVGDINARYFNTR